MRYAIYFSPHEDSALWQAGCRWLGRDPVSGAQLEQPAAGQLEPAALRERTASARRYGFHATLKAPFAMVAGMDQDGLYSELAAFARSCRPFWLPPLRVTRLGGFLALCLSQPSEQLDTLAAECVARFDRFRLPPTCDQQARRANGLSANQQLLLERWGYPYVMDEWRFHMTLTDQIDESEAATMRAVLRDWFDGALRERTRVSDLCVFVEPYAGAEMRLAARFPMLEAG